MNDREKAVTSERRNEGDYNAGVPRTSSTLWMKDTICSFEGTKKKYRKHSLKRTVFFVIILDSSVGRARGC